MWRLKHTPCLYGITSWHRGLASGGDQANRAMLLL
jgi:hypothetical protein